MKRYTASAIAVLVVTYGWSTKADVLIGVAGSMTGRNAWVGEQLQRGAEMAVIDINAAGGVLGHQVELITADDFCDPEQAVAAARKLVGDGVVFVAGHICSGASIPASEVYEQAGVIQISPASTNPLFTEQGRPNVFRVIGRDDAQGTVAGDYLADNWGGQKIAILHDGTIYGEGLADEAKRQLNKRGVTEAIYDSYVPGNADYTAEVATLEAADIAVAYVAGLFSEPALMARAAEDRNYPLQIVSGDAMASEEFSLVAGPAAEGILFTFTADARRNPEATEVVERFRAEGYEPTGYTLATYAAVQVWAHGVEKAGSLEPQAVIASLHAHEFETVVGRIAFNDKGDLTVQSWVWYVWRGGEYVPLDE